MLSVTLPVLLEFLIKNSDTWSRRHYLQQSLCSFGDMDISFIASQAVTNPSLVYDCMHLCTKLNKLLSHLEIVYLELAATDQVMALELHQWLRGKSYSSDRVKAMLDMIKTGKIGDDCQVDLFRHRIIAQFTDTVLKPSSIEASWVLSGYLLAKKIDLAIKLVSEHPSILSYVNHNILSLLDSLEFYLACEKIYLRFDDRDHVYIMALGIYPSIVEINGIRVPGKVFNYVWDKIDFTQVEPSWLEQCLTRKAMLDFHGFWLIWEKIKDIPDLLSYIDSDCLNYGASEAKILLLQSRQIDT